jgi:hypothetical protein
MRGQLEPEPGLERSHLAWSYSVVDSELLKLFDPYLSVQRPRSGAGWVGATRAQARGVTTQTVNWIALLDGGLMTWGGCASGRRIRPTPDSS